MVKYELKKILFYRRGLWLVMAVLAAEIAGMLFFTKPYDPILEENREVYERYLSQVEGALTEEKRTLIEETMEELSENRKQLDALETSFYIGEIPEEKFRPEFQQRSAVDADYIGFSKLYSQYIYVREDSCRSFLYTGGWEILLGTQNPSYLLLLLIVFLTAPIFCQEYASQMDMILLTQKKSGRDSWKAKTAAIFMLIGTIVTVWELCRLFYCASRFGLPDWNYSLQSVFSFCGTAKKMPLWAAWLLQLVLKQLGYLSCAAWVMFFSVLFRKYSATLMAGIVFLILPFLTVNVNVVFLRIPGPWAFTIGSIYLNSPSFYTGSRAIFDPMLAEFRELNWGELVLQIALAVGVLLALMRFVRKKSTNFHFHGGKKIMSAVLCGLLVLSMAGCGTNSKQPILYNSCLAQHFENDDIRIWSDPATMECQFIDQKTGKEYPFPLDVQLDEIDRYESYSFFERDGQLYYFLPGEQTLMKLDLKTLNQKAVRSWDRPYRWFFGLLPMPQTEETSFFITFFLHGSTLYGEQNGEMFRKNLKTGKTEPLTYVNTIPNYAYDGENLLYSDQYSRLVVENLDSGQSVTNENVVASFFLLAPEGVYFLNKQAHEALCLWDGETVQMLDQTSDGLRIFRDEDYLWLETRTNRLIRLNHDGTGRRELKLPGFLSYVGNGDCLYYDIWSEEGSARFQVEKDTLKITKAP